jgi:S1-C subfamily serine protease
MPFLIHCPTCGGVSEVREDVAGERVVCTRCQQWFIAEEPSRAAPWRDSPRVPERDLRAPRRSSTAVPVVAIVAGGGLLVAAAIAILVVCFVPQKRSDNADAAAGGSEQAAPFLQWPFAANDGAAEKARQPSGQLSAEALRHLKGATVFIKGEAGASSWAGSGFLCKVSGDTGYIVTNHHVVTADAEPLRPRRGPAGIPIPPVPGGPFRPNTAVISVVFHSGTPAERVLPAVVLASDEARDLAILRVQGLPEWPKPIRLDEKIDLVETMPVYILGFPFGEKLALKDGNPAITINKGSVSSLRDDKFGQIKAVQIDGALNPGNSGGPVVDEHGRLVGVSVATIRGSGIGLAIAPDELTRMFQERIGPIR